MLIRVLACRVVLGRVCVYGTEREGFQLSTPRVQRPILIPLFMDVKEEAQKKCPGPRVLWEKA